MSERSQGGSKFAVYASIVANLVIATTKFIAAALSGSSAMIAEGLHSLADTADGTLLLLGHHRARRPPDDEHPFGHGKELYFWSLIVAVIFFALGGGMSLYEGITHLLHPHPIKDPTWSYVVLAVAALVDGSSFAIGLHQFRKQKGDRGYLAAVLASKDPTLFTVLLEDSGDLAGITLAFLGVFLSHRLGSPVFDGLASIGVGLLLAAIAVFLANQSRALLVGEAADPAVLRGIREIAAADPDVTAVRRPLTMHLGPGDVLATMELQFRDGLSSSAIAGAVRRVERRIRQAHPEVTRVYLEASCLGGEE